jgi:hypothetical protein
MVLSEFAGGLVGNALGRPEDAEIFHAFARLVRERLGIPLTALGCLGRNPRLAEAGAGGKPLCAGRGMDDDVRVFHQLAEHLAAEHDEDERECALEGDGAPIPAAQLPLDLGRYQRRFPRLPVDWAATLEIAGEPNAVRVRDVSESGAGIESTLLLRPGDRGILHFYQLDDHLAVEVVVKNLVPAMNRVGLGFVNGAGAADRIVAAARARLAAP